MPRVLLVDDDSEALLSLTRALKAAGLQAAIDALSTPEQALQSVRRNAPHVVVLDLSLDQLRGVESGFALLQQILALCPACRVIVLTGHGTTEYGIRALELGAASFLQKPAEIPHLSALIKDGISQAEIKREHQRLLSESRGTVHSRLIGSSAGVARVREQVLYAASNTQAVLILGETGTGKGMCASEIHRLSNRSAANFIRYQPSFGTADLVNSELFGHTKGAFTGATENRRGLIADANKGTLFLDEIDQLPLETQVTLLGVLQDKVFRTMGSNRDEKVDFRLISASNAPLEARIAENKLRRDFYHRFAHFVITLPPLRERKEDLELIAQAALNRLREREQVNVVSIEPLAFKKLFTYDWPGNVRELEAVVEGAAFHAQFKGRAHMLEEDVVFHNAPLTGDPQVESFTARIASYRIKLIQDALNACGGNQVKAAELLGLDRNNMRRILARGITN